jgi:DNA-binding transcriptional MerR regulator
MADFDDGKDDGALRTIGEVSEALGIKPHILRYWEQQFPLLHPLKRSGGRRYYRPEDVSLVKEIDRLINQEKYTLKGAEAVLRSSGKGDLDRRQSDRRDGDRRSESPVSDHAAGVRVPSDGPDLGELIAGLKNVRARLARALES